MAAVRGLVQLCRAGYCTKGGGAAPSVFDKMVQLTVIDGAGLQRPLRGLEGQTFADVLRESGLFEETQFMPNPFEPAETDCHVYVSHQYLSKLPPLPEQKRAEHNRVRDDYVRLKARDNSIMGHYYKLCPAVNGITVAMGDIEPWQTW